MDSLINKDDTKLAHHEKLLHEQLGNLMYNFCITYFNRNPITNSVYDTNIRNINYYTNYKDATNYLRLKIIEHQKDFMEFQPLDRNTTFRVKMFIRELQRMKTTFTINISECEDVYDESIHSLRAFSLTKSNSPERNVAYSILNNENNIDGKFFMDNEEEYELDDDKEPFYIRIYKRGFMIKMPECIEGLNLVKYVKMVFNSMSRDEINLVERNENDDFVKDYVHDGYCVKML